jgi:hypothetical protein
MKKHINLEADNDPWPVNNLYKKTETYGLLQTIYSMSRVYEMQMIEPLVGPTRSEGTFRKGKSFQ